MQDNQDTQTSTDEVKTEYKRIQKKIAVEVTFFEPVQTSRLSHPASSIMGTGLFLGVKRLRVALITHPHLAPRLKKE